MFDTPPSNLPHPNAPNVSGGRPDKQNQTAPAQGRSSETLARGLPTQQKPIHAAAKPPLPTKSLTPKPSQHHKKYFIIGLISLIAIAAGYWVWRINTEPIVPGQLGGQEQDVTLERSDRVSDSGGDSITPTESGFQNDSIDLSVLDSDGDGLTDADEVNIYGTDPNNPDTDGDTYPDGVEIANGYNPLGPGKLVSLTPGLIGEGPIIDALISGCEFGDIDVSEEDNVMVYNVVYDCSPEGAVKIQVMKAESPAQALEGFNGTYDLFKDNEGAVIEENIFKFFPIPELPNTIWLNGSLFVQILAEAERLTAEPPTDKYNEVVDVYLDRYPPSEVQ